jgi:hypothetical protein
MKYVLLFVETEQQSASTATTVRLDVDSEPIVTDGPFVEGKEVVSGYTEVEADDLDQVLTMVRCAASATTAPSWRSCGGRSSRRRATTGSG